MYWVRDSNSLRFSRRFKPPLTGSARESTCAIVPNGRSCIKSFMNTTWRSNNTTSHQAFLTREALSAIAATTMKNILSVNAGKTSGNEIGVTS